jgi:MFS family permease
MLITMLVRETPLEAPPFDLPWRPILRLLVMVAAFTAIILGAGALDKVVMECASGLPAGWLADRVGKKPLVLVVGSSSAGRVFLFLAVPTLMILYTGASLIGAGAGLFYSANWALGTELVPLEQAGRYLGISNLAGAGAGAVGAYIGGPIADDYGYVLVVGIYGLLFLISLLALFGIREAKPRMARA